MVAPFVTPVQRKGGACEYTGEARADEKRGEGDSEKIKIKLYNMDIEIKYYPEEILYESIKRKYGRATYGS